MADDDDPGQAFLKGHMTEAGPKEGEVTGLTSRGVPIIPKSSAYDKPSTDYENKPIKDRVEDYKRKSR